MRNWVLKIALPLAVISFGICTKWWYAIPIDAPDTIFVGFPLAYSCPGWHTSMSLQIFLMEFLIDFLLYFLFWFTILFFFDRFLIKIKTFKWITAVLWSLSSLFTAWGILHASNSDNIFHLKRPFDIQVLKTGWKPIWQQPEHPDYNMYSPMISS
jgi:hypothetical protein